MNSSKYYLIILVVTYILVYSVSVIVWGIKMCSGQKQKNTIVPVNKQQQLSYEYNAIDMVVVNKQHNSSDEMKKGIDIQE